MVLEESTFDMDDVRTSGGKIERLIDQEIANNAGIDNTNLYLAGLSQGGQMTFHTAFGQLTQKLAGYFAFVTCPMWPVF